jgi:nitrate/TMAO reductase-like tetraheme cytochrome c subunit
VPAIGLVVALLLAGAGLLGAIRLTDRPSFCGSCHEMRPYSTAWNGGPHKSVSCVECHVDPGAVSQATHKVAALREVWVHVTGDPRFPKERVEVPDARCVVCHPNVPETSGSRFSHALHASRRDCTGCHPGVGHEVSSDALSAEGILATGTGTPARLVPVSRIAGTKEPTSSAHVRIGCSNCHDLDKLACATCHASKHPRKGTCQTCHRAGASWAFVHPASAECSKCHPAPTRHFLGACGGCHAPSVPFKSTVFKHTSTDCGSCHPAPAKHSTALACAGCHRDTGRSWRFAHPDASGCASCHAAPTRHYGNECSRCHTPSRAWAGATFSHPSTQHDYRSIACVQCHPSTYAQAYCSCHGGGAPSD